MFGIHYVVINNVKFVIFQVHWVQQQHEKKRRKRDFSVPNLPSTVFAGSADFYQQTSGVPISPLAQGQSFRRLGNSAHNVFPDPLYKEQWYLVSGCISSAFNKIMR